MHTTFENGVLRNGQQPGSAVNSSIDQGEFRAMKTLSGRIAPHFDKHQFYIVVEHCGVKKERNTLLRLAVFRVAFGHLFES